MLESYIVDKVKARFKSTGWISRKMMYQGRRGAPDDWFFGPGARLIIIEFKQHLKKPNIQQRKEHERLIERGFRVFVVDSVEAGYKLHADLEREYEVASLA